MPVDMKPNETRKQFISRCMSIEKEKFPDAKQRAAVCFSMWKEHQKNKRAELEKERINSVR